MNLQKLTKVLVLRNGRSRKRELLIFQYLTSHHVEGGVDTTGGSCCLPVKNKGFSPLVYGDGFTVCT